MNGESDPLDGWHVVAPDNVIHAGREYRIGHVTHRHPSGGTITLVGPPITDPVDVRVQPDSDFIYYTRTENTPMRKPEYDRPTGLTLLDEGDEDLQMKWNPVPYADFYVVKLATNSSFTKGVEYHRTADLGHPPNTTRFGPHGLAPETKYWFKVAVCNFEGVRLSDYSTVKTGTTHAP